MKHHRSIMALHWLTAIVIAAIVSAIFYRTGLEDGDQRKFWLDVHRALGLSVLIIVLARLVFRLRFGRERVVETTPVLHLASAIAQGVLYIAMIALPLLGWAQSSARARHFKLFDIPMPTLIAHDPERADLLGEWHESIAWIFLAVIALHILGALFHRFVRKDGVMQSMLPGKPTP